MNTRFRNTLERTTIVLLLTLSMACKRNDKQIVGWLELCTGFATPVGGMLLGRLHAGAQPESHQPGESKRQRIAETLAVLEANPLPNVPLLVTVGGRPFKGVRSNDRGYVDLSPLAGFVPPAVHVRLEVEDSIYQISPVDADLPVYDNEPGLGVISDIDDTLLNSHVTDKLQLLERAATRSTWELETFPGAVTAVKLLTGNRPIFYVSGSPWGFRERIQDFFQRVGFPQGPLLLKRFSSDPWADQVTFKWQHLSQILTALPRKRWLLLGDSGEKDPEIYARLARERPDRVEAIYIHLITAEDPLASRFQGMRVFRDWTELTAPSAPPTPMTSPR